MVDFQIKKQWQQSVHYAQPEGVDISGSPKTGSPILMENVRVEAVDRQTKGTEGIEHIETHRIFSETKIPFNSLIWLAEEDITKPDQARFLLSSKRCVNEFGKTSHFESTL